LTGFESVFELIGIIKSFESLLRGIFYVVGLILVVQSLRNAARRSELGPQFSSWLSPLAGFVIGLLLLALPSAISLLSESLFGISGQISPSSIFQYDNDFIYQLNTGNVGELIELVVMIIQFLGFIAIVRSLLLFNQIGTQGSRVVGPGITFLIAGTLSVNFPLFWGLLVDVFLGLSD